MRSPVVAFSLFAAAAVSVSANSALPKSPDLPGPASALGPSTLAVDPPSSTPLKYESPLRRESPVGLGIVDATVRDAKAHVPPSHDRRMVVEPRRVAERVAEGRNGYGSSVQRQDGRIPPPLRPEPPQLSGSSSGCSNGNTDTDADGVDQDDAIYGVTGDSNGGVSCSNSVQGQPADQTGQLGSGESVASPNAGPADGIPITNTRIDTILGDDGTDGGTSTSPSVVGADGDEDDAARSPYGSGYGRGYPGTRTRPRRSLGTLSQQDARKDLYEMVNSTVTENSEKLVRRAPPPANARGAADLVPPIAEDRSPNGPLVLDGVDSDITGAPGESIRGAAIPGVDGAGFAGGNAYPGAVGSSQGGRVIESGRVVDEASDVTRA